MYIPKQGPKPEKKFFVVWRVRNNEDSSWLTKEDCPSVVHPSYALALKEADRLAESTGYQFTVMEAVVVVNKRKVVPEIKSEVSHLKP